MVGEQRWGTMQALGMKRLLDAIRGRPTFSSFALLLAAMGMGVFAFLALWIWRAGSRTGKTSKRKAGLRVQPITSGILAADK
jgi:ABC-type phosphate/phosphonate transport system permease subunit